MNFFLQGDSGIGKSYLLHQHLKSYQPMLTGWWVQRLYQQEALTGFRLRSPEQGFGPLDWQVKEQDAFNLGEGGVFLYQGKRDVSVLEQAVEMIEEDSRKQRCKMILLDEIGGVELASDRFVGKLRRLLEGEIPCIGVWKSARNLDNMVKRQRLDEGYLWLHRELEQELRKSGLLLTMTEKNRRFCESKLKEYLDQSF